MRRDLFSIPRILLVLASAGLIFAGDRGSTAILHSIAGESSGSQSIAAHSATPPLVAFALFAVVSALLSFLQDVKRPNGATWAIGVGVAFGAVTFASRALASPPADFAFAAALGLGRGAAAVLACVLLYYGKRMSGGRAGASIPSGS